MVDEAVGVCTGQWRGELFQRHFLNWFRAEMNKPIDQRRWLKLPVTNDTLGRFGGWTGILTRTGLMTRDCVRRPRFGPFGTRAHADYTDEKLLDWIRSGAGELPVGMGPHRYTACAKARRGGARARRSAARPKRPHHLRPVRQLADRALQRWSDHRPRGDPTDRKQKFTDDELRHWLQKAIDWSGDEVTQGRYQVWRAKRSRSSS